MLPCCVGRGWILSLLLSLPVEEECDSGLRQEIEAIHAGVVYVHSSTLADYCTRYECVSE